MNNNKCGYIDMWDNWTKKRTGVLAYDNWLDDYKDKVIEKIAEIIKN